MTCACYLWGKYNLGWL